MVGRVHSPMLYRQVDYCLMAEGQVVAGLLYLQLNRLFYSRRMMDREFFTLSVVLVCFFVYNILCI